MLKKETESSFKPESIDKTTLASPPGWDFNKASLLAE
jgi:hypothetical protein